MVPNKFSMVDLDGIDIVESQGVEIPGLYQKLTNAIAQCRYQVIYNWKFDGILIPPAYVEMEIDGSEVKINENISVSNADIVYIHSLEIHVHPVINELSVTEDGEYYVPEGVDGYNPVIVNVSPSLVSLTATENDTYYPPQEYAGFSSVNVIVPPEKTSDNLVVNWDFSNPINTRGQSSYSGNNTSAIDGWVTFQSEMRIVTGGIVVKRTGTNGGFFIQRTKPGNINYYSGKQMTISAIIDGELYSDTFSVPTSQGGSSGIGIDGECTVRIYRQGNGIIEITIDASPMNSQEHIVSAYKLEFGSSQTLATKVNGVWVLNQDMNVDNEKLKQYILLN